MLKLNIFHMFSSCCGALFHGVNRLDLYQLIRYKIWTKAFSTTQGRKTRAQIHRGVPLMRTNCTMSLPRQSSAARDGTIQQLRLEQI
jgi:hypothetical protein